MHSPFTPANTTITPVSRAAISARIAEWLRRSRGRSELLMLTDHDLSDLPFTMTDARAEAAKWFWQR